MTQDLTQFPEKMKALPPLNPSQDETQGRTPPPLPAPSLIKKIFSQNNATGKPLTPSSSKLDRESSSPGTHGKAQEPLSVSSEIIPPHAPQKNTFTTIPPKENDQQNKGPSTSSSPTLGKEGAENSTTAEKNSSHASPKKEDKEDADTSATSPSGKTSGASSAVRDMHDRVSRIVSGNEQFIAMRKKFPGLGHPIALAEEDLPKGSRLNIYIICLMILAFCIWATITPIKEIAVGQGQVTPSSFVKSIQHLEGGIVKQIYVEDGQEVKEGDLLLKLDEAAALSELDQLSIREMALRIKAERLRAFGLNQQPDFNQFKSVPTHLIDDQRSIFEMQSKNRNDQRDIILKQVEQKKSALTIQEGRVNDLEHRTSVLEKQRDIIKGLYDKRLKTGTEYRETEDKLAEVLVELNQAKNSVEETKQAIGEQESRLVELDTRLRNDSLVEMGNVTAEIAQIAESKLKSSDRVKRLEIRSPAAGIVKGLKNTTLQGVIQPGAEIVQVVPKDKLEVEARILPKDVGKLKEGQPVLVKVTAFDYARYGGINGSVKSISATTFLDEKNNPYYRVLVSLSQLYVGKNTSDTISPGMTVQADIQTDQKTLFQFLIKPIYVALNESFRER